MYLENRLLGTHDFVDGDDYVYQSSTHGTSVLSTMAAKRPHLLVGTAPDASYYLFRTEDVKGEYRLEEFNWIVAMEYADSLGADIVNSSMGYNQFRDTSMSYTYQDMDGQTTLISRGAALAVAKGLLIVNAIGNDGNKAWRYLFAPADVTTVLTVGAVDSFRQSSRFSSRGPSSDGRLKPDIVAQGSSTAYATMTRYDVALGEGTSYACPVMTGMVASLKSAFPTLQNQLLKEAIFKSSHQANKPDYDQGYGIPNFLAAYLYLLEDYIMLDQNIPQKDSTRFLTSNCHILVRANQPTQLTLKAYDYFGRLIEEKLIYYSKPKPSSFKLPLSTISKVCYLQITTNNKRYFYKINKKP
jgi:subtilisin family serine protease